MHGIDYNMTGLDDLNDIEEKDKPKTDTVYDPVTKKIKKRVNFAPKGKDLEDTRNSVNAS